MVSGFGYWILKPGRYLLQLGLTVWRSTDSSVMSWAVAKEAV